MRIMSENEAKNVVVVKLLCAVGRYRMDQITYHNHRSKFYA